MFDKYKKNKNSGTTFDDSDIFADFSGDNHLKKDVENFKKQEKRDVFDIMNIISMIIKVINILLLIFIFLSIMYIYIQKDETFSETSTLSSVINPVCYLFIKDEIAKEAASCRSVTFALNEYNGKISDLKKSQSLKIASIINSVYKTENFINSKEVVFLKENMDNRLKPSKILDDFEKLNDNFTSGAEEKNIVCKDLLIDKDHILSASCSARTAGWEKTIVGYNGGDGNQKFYGSSISLANSFLDYISKGDSNFTLMDRQKSFSSNGIVGGVYTEETSFTIKLKYVNNNLSL